MDGSRAVAISFTRQIDSHTPITVNTVMSVVDFFYLTLDFCFLGIIIRLPVFAVVVISIRVNPQPSSSQRTPNSVWCCSMNR